VAKKSALTYAAHNAIMDKAHIKQMGRTTIIRASCDVGAQL
jgi:hypothetical protein